MIEPAELAQFVRDEQAAQLAAAARADLLSRQALVALGQAVDGLQITRRGRHHVELQTETNFSRFRPGDALRFSCGEAAFGGELLEVAESGRKLIVAPGRDTTALPTGPWLALQDNFDNSRTVIEALDQLMPGAPGWSYFQLLNGRPKPTAEPRSTEDLTRFQAIYNELAQDSGQALDASQRDVFLRCLACPPLLGVQGPPGTGKTLVLAFVAEALVRKGQRVVITAPTHQAVNNALSTLHGLFPARPVVKAGRNLHTEALSPGVRVLTLRRASLAADTIIGLTFAAAFHHLILGDTIAKPNVLIVDEAGQVPLAQGACAGASGAGSVLLFGDDQQMPPVFTGDVNEAPLATSVFAWLRSYTAADVVRLAVTHRLNQTLCDAIGQAFYASGNVSLRPSAEAVGRRLPAHFAAMAPDTLYQDTLDPDEALIWLQVPGRTSTQHNLREAALAADLVAHLVGAGLPPDRVAVVTPFRRQVMRIRGLLEKLLPMGAPQPIVDTVERVQGLTVDVIVTSLVASEPDYVTAVARFLFSPNRLNVAISRARCKAIVLSAPEIFDVLPADFAALQALGRCKQLMQRAHQIVAHTLPIARPWTQRTLDYLDSNPSVSS